MTPSEYLASFLPSREEVDRFLTVADASGLNPNRGWTFHPVMGWVHADAMHDGDGVGGTRTYYAYETDDGARQVINGRGNPCRIHTYGDSFTHCDQVSNGETWQEYLAGHLQEPVRNYGAGGYSVYQAYRRFLYNLEHSPHEAKYVILNIWEDDHYRNLDAWRRLRFGRATACGYTLPHLRVNLQSGEVRERENLVPTAAEAYHMCELDWAEEHFSDDPVLKLILAAKGEAEAAVDPVAVSFGLPANLVAADESGEEIRALHTRAALMATQYVVTQMARTCDERGIKLMVVLSFGMTGMRSALAGEARFDASFTTWLERQAFPVVDMRDAFGEAFGRSRESAEDFVGRYYCGHHNPAGNFFTAWALMATLVEWLDPVPVPYQS